MNERWPAEGLTDWLGWFALQILSKNELDLG